MTIDEHWTFDARPVRIIDGDTQVYDARTFVDTKRQFVVRLLGVDTPELRAKDPEVRERAKLAREFASAVLFGVDAKTTLELRLTGLKDVYGRWLGSVYVQGASLADLLVESGYGERVEYEAHVAALTGTPAGDRR